MLAITTVKAKNTPRNGGAGGIGRPVTFRARIGKDRDKKIPSAKDQRPQWRNVVLSCRWGGKSLP